MMDDVKRWEGQLVDGRFPLRQYLGGSEHSAVFLTEWGRGQNAAIKLIPLDPATADPQLARWKQAAGFSHPHLLRIFETGRCRIENDGFLFVVMEYAEEDLSQILPQRALTPREAQQMLEPVVEVLRYLHGKGWVHGHLRPSNILASGDQVKISSDGVRKAGEKSSGVDKASVYDPPEKAKGGQSAAGDVWALGVTLTESLTRQLPKTNGNDRSELRLPEGLTSPFLDIARNCLWRDPRQRWAIPEIAAQLSPSSGETDKEETGAAKKEESLPAAVAEPLETTIVEEHPPARRAIWALVLLSIASAGGIYLVNHGSEKSAPGAPAVAQQSAPGQGTASKASSALPVEKPSTERSSGATSHAAGDEIVERDVPNIPRSARGTITGKVKVRVRVNVDSSGNVVGAKFDARGPSEYFARQAEESARRWKFTASPEEQRQWVLLFEFARGGTQVIPTRVSKKH